MRSTLMALMNLLLAGAIDFVAVRRDGGFGRSCLRLWLEMIFHNVIQCDQDYRSNRENYTYMWTASSLLAPPQTARPAQCRAPSSPDP